MNGTEGAAVARRRYVPGLDGIRGMAVVAVIAIHCGNLQCGWIGVQSFFVLSGYLITGILLDETDRPPGQYFGQFYWRRVLRIFPAYFAYLLACAITYLLLRHPVGAPRHFPWLLTYTYNLYMARPGVPNTAFFAHLWSLSVEEQFYLIWPWLVFFLNRRALRWLVVCVIVLVPFARVVWFVYAQSSGTPLRVIGRTLYLLTPFQIDSFAAGAAIALFKLIRLRVSAVMLVSAGAVAVGIGFFNLTVGHYVQIVPGSGPMHVVTIGPSFGYPILMTHNAQFLWGYTVVNFLCVALIISASQPSIVSRFLSCGPLVYLGRISYGMYLYHFAVVELMRSLVPVNPQTAAGFGLFLLIVATVVAIAHLSYYHFERHFLRLKDQFTRAGLAGAATAPPVVAAVG